MKGTKTIALAAATLLLTGCFHGIHDLQPGFGGFAPTLRWEQAEDADTPVHHVYLAVSGSSVSYTREFSGTEAVSNELQQLPEGEYDVLVTVNMSEADGFLFEGLPSTKSFRDKAVSGKISLSSLDTQGWFGAGTVNVTGTSIYGTTLNLQRALATLSVRIDNVPAHMQVSAVVTNAAQGIVLTTQDDNGRLGRPSAGIDARVVRCGNGGSINLMPTASGQSHSTVTIQKENPDGSVQEAFHVTAPPMESGKSYQLNVDFNELRAEMTVAPSDINDWVEEWTLQGTVPDPE